jgi:hypothetical protein
LKLVDWRDLERELRRLGYEIVDKRPHKRIMRDGKFVGSLPSTPSDRSHGVRNKVGELRARGILPYPDGRYADAPINRLAS